MSLSLRIARNKTGNVRKTLDTISSNVFHAIEASILNFLVPYPIANNTGQSKSNWSVNVVFKRQIYKTHIQTSMLIIQFENSFESKVV